MSLVGASLIGVFAGQEVALGEPAGAEVTDGTGKKHPGREVVISVLVAYGSGSSPRRTGILNQSQGEMRRVMRRSFCPASSILADPRCLTEECYRNDACQGRPPGT